MPTRILVAGDHFILPGTFADAIRAEVQDAELQFNEYQSPWPGVPFGNIGEVTEASGSEDEVIAALQGASILAANHAPLTERVLAAAPDLRLAVSRAAVRPTPTSRLPPRTASSSVTPGP